MPEIDGLRFVAIMAVVIHHLIGLYVCTTSICPGGPVNWQKIQGINWLIDLSMPGRYGVHFFFIISGFVLALPFAGYYLGLSKKVSLKSYYLRRIRRIEPPYIICMVLMFLFFYGFSGKFMEMLPHLGASLIYGYTLLIGEYNLINNVAWSLEVEVQFYILAPALGMLFMVRKPSLRRLLMLLLIIACGCLSQYIIEDIPRVRLTIINNLQFFLMGFFLADLYIQVRDRSILKSILWDMVGLAGLALSLYIFMCKPRLSLVLFPFTGALFFIAAFRGKYLNKVLTTRLLIIVGGMCYTIYLYHFRLLTRIFSTEMFADIILYPFWKGICLRVILMVPLVLCACTIMYMLFERPFMKNLLTSSNKTGSTPKNP